MIGQREKSLSQQLGLKAGMRVHVVGAPVGYAELLEPLPEQLRFLKRLGRNLDLIHLFAGTQSTLLSELPRAVPALAKDGALWISWPKRSSGVVSDIDEARVRKLGLDAGLVDVKVCAIDETWSGLKFMYRLKDR